MSANNGNAVSSKALLFYNLPLTFTINMLNEVVTNLPGVELRQTTLGLWTVAGMEMKIGKVFFLSNEQGEQGAEYFFCQALMSGSGLKLEVGDKIVSIRYGPSTGNGMTVYG